MSQDVVRAALEAAEYWPTGIDEDDRRSDDLFWFRMPFSGGLLECVSTCFEQRAGRTAPPLHLQLDMANARLSPTSRDVVLTGRMALSVHLLEMHLEAGSILLKTRSCTHSQAPLAQREGERIRVTGAAL